MAQHPLQEARYRLQRMSQDVFHLRPLLAQIGTFDTQKVVGWIEGMSKVVEQAAEGQLPLQALNPTYELVVVIEGALGAQAYPHTVRDALQDNPGRVLLKGPTETVLASSLESGAIYRAALYHPKRTYRLWLERTPRGWNVDTYRVDDL